MRARKIDLNLLVMLETLVAERSASKAAQRMGLTQSAVSHSLRRLRDIFNEPLFVRLPSGMEPTRRALEIASATRLALEQIEQTIHDSAVFEPATAQRSFTLRLSEYVSSALLRRLCPVLRIVAPGVRIDAMHFTGDPREDEIIGDEIHVRLADSGSVVGRRERLRVVDEKFGVLMRNTHAARPDWRCDVRPRSCRLGYATRSFPLAELDEKTLDFAERAAKVPVELQQLNKRSVHRAMEIMGARAAIRAGTEIQALAFTTEASRAYMGSFRRDGSSVKDLLDQRDTTFGDYRTKKE
ncbi:DNA-binding transcriptional LysR family regulator [Bradyrhizobium sp. LB14.3]|uniref:LysR family transcriptional regulator n=1 Tax=Bradyrhizobium sp. LB14.3 TaxID=3156328 RepID=UPI003396AEF7